MQSIHHQTNKHIARNYSMWYYTQYGRRGILTKTVRSSPKFYKTSITSSLSVHWEDFRMIPFRREPWSSLAQSPAQSRVHYEIRSGSSQLHLAWSWKPLRMEAAEPPQATCSSLIAITTRKLFLETTQIWDGVSNICGGTFQYLLNSIWNVMQFALSRFQTMGSKNLHEVDQTLKIILHIKILPVPCLTILTAELGELISIIHLRDPQLQSNVWVSFYIAISSKSLLH